MQAEIPLDFITIQNSRNSEKQQASIEGKSNKIPVEFGIKIKKKLTSFQKLLPAFTSW